MNLISNVKTISHDIQNKTKSFFPLNPLHQKIILVASLAIGLIASLYLAYKFIFAKKSKNQDSLKTTLSKSEKNQQTFTQPPISFDPIQNPPSIPPQSSPFKNSPSIPPQSPPFKNSPRIPPQSPPSVSADIPSPKSPVGPVPNLPNIPLFSHSKENFYKPGENKFKGHSDQDVESITYLPLKELIKARINIYNENKNIQDDDKLNKLLKEYLEKLRSYFEESYKNIDLNQDEHIRNIVFEEITLFGGILDMFSNNETFIINSFKTIDLFLSNIFFQHFTAADEKQKDSLACLWPFLDYCNKYYPKIQEKDAELAKKLKIKIANIPVPPNQKKQHSDYKNLYLSLKEQLQFLIEHFKKREDELLLKLIKAIDYKEFTQKDKDRLAKILQEDQNFLSQSNLKLLSQSIEKKLKLKTIPLSNQAELRKVINNLPSRSYDKNHDALENLYYIVKAKKFFEQQKDFEEEKIALPRWYHCTKEKNIISIIQKGELLVTNDGFLGAWVSTNRAIGYGNFTFAFSHNISLMEPKEEDKKKGIEKGDVAIHTKIGSSIRWRGLQISIPILNINNQGKVEHLLIYIGLPKPSKNIGYFPHEVQYTKNDLKELKEKIKVLYKQQLATLKSKNAIDHDINIPIPPIISNDMIEFIQKEYFYLLGSPNLAEKWF